MGGRKRSQRKKGEYFPFFHPTTKYFYSERKKRKKQHETPFGVPWCVLIRMTFRHYISTTIDGSRRKHHPLSPVVPYIKREIINYDIRPVLSRSFYLFSRENKERPAINNVLFFNCYINMSIAKQQAQPRQPQVGYVLIPAYNILNSNFVSIQQDGHHLWTTPMDNKKSSSRCISK
jgi:hypothetical protein